MLLLLASALFAWTHRDALSLLGFADDLALMLDLPEQARKSMLLDQIQTRLVGSVWGPGSIMWRPLPFASIGLPAISP